ncbi:MAG: UDP-N-acetylmuramoyl-L-alanine--D-glutamate ligase [Acidobacteriota bacterium]
MTSPQTHTQDPGALPRARMPWGATDPATGAWRRAVVHGLGLSGRSAAVLLRRLGVQVVAFDARSADLLGADLESAGLVDDAGLRLLLGEEPDALPRDLDWADVDGVVVSPGVPMDRPLLVSAREAGVPVIAEVELAFPYLRGPVLAITGTNGKSTTTAMAGAMLRAAGMGAEVCGNIGEALTSRVDAAGVEEGTPFVVELSSFQLEAVDRFRPAAAALLNLAPDHLDRHADFAAYRDAKLAIFRRQDAGDVAVLNADDPGVVSATASLAARRRYFSRAGAVADGCHLDGDLVVEVAPEADPLPLFAVSDVPLPGPHNLENAMAASLLARTRGTEPAAIAHGLRRFQGLPHRLELVRERAGVRWYDDSKGTNLAATLKSLAGFDDGLVVAIFGGRFKGGDLSELAALAARKVRRAFVIGESADRFVEALAAAGVAYDVAETLDRAVTSASKTAVRGEVVLLSPACSSFDQFPNFAERGRVFQRLVNELPAEAEGGSHGP